MAVVVAAGLPDKYPTAKRLLLSGRTSWGVERPLCVDINHVPQRHVQHLPFAVHLHFTLTEAAVCGQGTWCVRPGHAPVTCALMRVIRGRNHGQRCMSAMMDMVHGHGQEVRSTATLSHSWPQ